MKSRSITVVMLSLLAACSSKGDSNAANTGNTAGSAVAGTSPAPVGAAGVGTAGTVSAAGSGTAGATTTTAGMTGGTAGATPTAGTSAGVSGGTAGTSTTPTMATTAGASGSSSSDIPPATFETVKLVLGGGGPIMPCAAAPCHGVNGAAPPDKPLELPPTDDAKLYANLTSYVSKACDNTKLVTPGNPSQSALLRILRGPCGMTPRMPYGCTADAGDCIPDEYIAAVQQWIMNGAPQQ